MTKLSILDLVYINQDGTVQEALHKGLRLIQKAEDLGYERFWVAEHHNAPAIASAATSVVIGYLAQGTKKIRVGAGGIMLPNHSPLVIAEQFGTLESLYPGRIDLGLGRAPGTDQKTVRALRRDPMSAQNFPNDVKELQEYLSDESSNSIQAIPGQGTNVPLWILGSSTFGAQLAAHMGLPYAFASHFAPEALTEAAHLYRNGFSPSEKNHKSYFMAGINVIVADTDEEARFLFTSLQQAFADLGRGRRSGLRPPIEDIESYWSPQEKIMASHMLRYSVVGAPETVRKGLQKFISVTGVDELMIVGTIYDEKARHRSFELLAELAQDL